MSPEEKLDQVLANQEEILRFLRGFQATFDRFQHLLPNPTGAMARLLKR